MKMKKIIQKIVVGGVCIKNKKVLIIQRSSDEEYFPNYWEIPSGKKELLENVDEALRREFKEETGIDIKVGKPISVFNYKWEDKNSIRDATQIVFLVKSIVYKPKVLLSSEHQNYAWITKDNISRYQMSDEVKEIILETLTNL